MKNRILFSAVLAIFLTAQVSQAQKMSRAQASSVFDQLKKGTKFNATPQAQTKGLKLSTVIPGSVTVPPVPINGGTGTAAFGLRLWFVVEQSNGTDLYVDPTRRRWQPGEQFRLMVEPSVPMTLAINQKLPTGQHVTVYPVQGQITTFSHMLPGQITMLPFPFELDKDFQPENLQFLFARADSNVLNIAGGGGGGGNVGTNNGGNSGGGNPGISGGGGSMKSFLNQVNTVATKAATGTVNGASTKLSVIVPPDQVQLPGPHVTVNINGGAPTVINTNGGGNTGTTIGGQSTVIPDKRGSFIIIGSNPNLNQMELTIRKS